jgi:hypothetical protein
MDRAAAESRPGLPAPVQRTSRSPGTSGPAILPLLELQAVKSSLGPIQHLDLTAYGVPEAHFHLGADVGARVALFLRKRLEGLGDREVENEIRLARGSWAEVERRRRSRDLHPTVRLALDEYARSLQAWAAGAGLADFARSDLGGLRVDGVPVGAEDLACLLQNELNGCQTGVFREDDSSVILWHTEEDREYPGIARFDKLRVASFRAPGDGSRAFTGFIYPDLLPGPAFGWSGSSYAHAVDAFYLRPADGSAGLTANAVTWVCLYLAGAMTTREIAQALAPFRDGYALSSVSRTGSGLQGDTTEFIAGTVHSTPLPGRPSSSLFKVNFLSGTAAAASDLENIQPERRRVLERRVVRTGRALRALAQSEDRVSGFSRLLASRVGGEFAYANPSVKAHFLCRMAQAQTQIWVGPGPAIREDHFFASAWSPGG